jgi:hypothetical protein
MSGRTSESADEHAPLQGLRRDRRRRFASERVLLQHLDTQ